MPSSSRSSHYQRFIPREEVRKVSAWEFGPVVVPPPAAVPEEAVAAEPVFDAAEVEQLRQQAYQSGFADGLTAGAEQARLELEQQMQEQLEAQTRAQAERMDALLHQAQTHLDRLEHALADEVLELACELARQVVRRELGSPLGPLRAVVGEALALACADARPASLRLHPDDAALLEHDPLLAQTQVRLVPDAQLSPGDCVLEHSQGSVDARLERRWSRAVANLGLQAPWQPVAEQDSV